MIYDIYIIYIYIHIIYIYYIYITESSFIQCYPLFSIRNWYTVYTFSGAGTYVLRS